MAINDRKYDPLDELLKERMQVFLREAEKNRVAIEACQKRLTQLDDLKKEIDKRLASNDLGTTDLFEKFIKILKKGRA
jgi:hypothetical protein